MFSLSCFHLKDKSACLERVGWELVTAGDYSHSEPTERKQSEDAGLVRQFGLLGILHCRQGTVQHGKDPCRNGERCKSLHKRGDG